MNRIDLNADAKEHAFRWGIIGLGHVGSIHTWAIKEMGHRLNGFSTSNTVVQSGDATGLIFNIGDIPGPLFDPTGMNVTDDYRQLLADPDVDGVIIAAPTKFHVDIALDTAKAGKHCFLEKPMAPTYADSMWILDAFSRSNGRLVVGHVLPSFPEFELLRREIRTNGIENVVRVLMTRHVDNSRTDDEADTVERGGFAADLGIHDANLLLGLGTPTTVKTITAWRRYKQIQWMEFEIGMRETEGKFVCSVGALGDTAFHHSYHVRFRDGQTLNFDGTKVIRNEEIVEVTPKTVPRIFGDELSLAVKYFLGKSDASFLAATTAQRTLQILEAAAESSLSKATITL